MRKLQRLIVVAIILMVAGVAQAATVPADGGTALNSVFDRILNDGHITTATNTFSPDQRWQASHSGSINTLEYYTESIAGAKFGIYDVSTGNKLEIFSDTTTNRKSVFWADATTAIVTSVGLVGESGSKSAQINLLGFGYYLEYGGNTYYSEESRNSGVDHMLAYKGNGVDRYRADGLYFTDGDFLLAWDATNTFTFTDYVISVESSYPSAVPEPSSILLLGGGLIGLGFAGYRRLQGKQ